MQWTPQEIATTFAGVARSVLSSGEVKEVNLPVTVDETSMFVLTTADGKKFRVIVKESK